MRVKKSLQHVTKSKKNRDAKGELIHNFAIISGCALLSVGIAVGSKVAGNDAHSQVYAASESESNSASAPSESAGIDRDYLPTGIAGVVSGVSDTPSAGTVVKRIGTSCETVMVGQRVKKVENGAAQMDLSSSMESTVNGFDSTAVTLAQNPTIMSDTDYDTLLRIVEAEAGSEDVKGRVMVANVIMNRVKSEEFPDTVTEVVWDYSYGVPQFSPTYDGRIGEVTVTEETREAVKQALEGTDYSEGALFFIEKAAAEKSNVLWFERDLKKLFKYGVHEFYTYPTEEELKEREKAEKKKAGNEDVPVVQMVKNDILE